MKTGLNLPGWDHLEFDLNRSPEMKLEMQMNSSALVYVGSGHYEIQLWDFRYISNVPPLRL
jgi:hypothetical protein